MLFKIIRLWFKWRKDWDSLCYQCGKCCYSRCVTKDGFVYIYKKDPCEYLDVNTHKCRIYNERFKKCKHCGKVNIFTALFNKTMPEDCAYVKTFRLWDKRLASEEDDEN